MEPLVIAIRRTQSAEDGEWNALRIELWPDIEPVVDDLASWLQSRPDYFGFVATSADGAAIGFAEASVRTDYVNGCDSSPVAFLEGLYVRPSFRRQKVARQLLDEVTNWAREQGCRELASDTQPDNADSLRTHEALGFVETERVVFLRKML